MNFSSQPVHPEIDCFTVKLKIDTGAELLLLDCREEEEYQFVRLPGSQCIPMSAIQERIVELEPHRETEIVVYCHRGMRSLQVTMWLLQQGFADVKSLAGGIDRWSQEIDLSLPRY